MLTISIDQRAIEQRINSLANALKKTKDEIVLGALATQFDLKSLAYHMTRSASATK